MISSSLSPFYGKATIDNRRWLDKGLGQGVVGRGGCPGHKGLLLRWGCLPSATRLTGVVTVSVILTGVGLLGVGTPKVAHHEWGGGAQFGIIALCAGWPCPGTDWTYHPWASVYSTVGHKRWCSNDYKHLISHTGFCMTVFNTAKILRSHGF